MITVSQICRANSASTMTSDRSRSSMIYSAWLIPSMDQPTAGRFVTGSRRFNGRNAPSTGCRIPILLCDHSALWTQFNCRSPLRCRDKQIHPELRFDDYRWQFCAAERQAPLSLHGVTCRTGSIHRQQAGHPLMLRAHGRGGIPQSRTTLKNFMGLDHPAPRPGGAYCDLRTV